MTTFELAEAYARLWNLKYIKTPTPEEKEQLDKEWRQVLSEITKLNFGDYEDFRIYVDEIENKNNQ